MLSLLGVTFVASFTDSMNPIAITQQMILQSVSKRKKDILGFVIGIALTNFAFGLLFYFGLAQLLQRLLLKITEHIPNFLPMLSISSGLILLLYSAKQSVNKNKNQSVENNQATPRKLGFIQLFGLGVMATVMELTSAVPYLAFLTFLLQYSLDTLLVILILVIYNILFSWPLIFLYIVSLYFEHYLTAFYKKLSTIISCLLTKLLPVLGFTAGILLLIYGMIKIFL